MKVHRSWVKYEEEPKWPQKRYFIQDSLAISE